MYPFAYHATICSEFTDWKNEERAGVTFGSTFHDAVAHIEDYYGEELMFLTIGAINEEQSVLELPEEVVSELESEAY